MQDRWSDNTAVIEPGSLRTYPHHAYARSYLRSRLAILHRGLHKHLVQLAGQITSEQRIALAPWIRSLGELLDLEGSLTRKEHDHGAH